MRGLQTSQSPECHPLDEVMSQCRIGADCSDVLRDQFRRFLTFPITPAALASAIASFAAGIGLLPEHIASLTATTGAIVTACRIADLLKERSDIGFIMVIARRKLVVALSKVHERDRLKALSILEEHSPEQWRGEEF